MPLPADRPTYLDGAWRRTIGDLIDGRIEVYARCMNSRCGHVAQLDLSLIAARKGRQYSIWLLGQRIRCRLCADDGEIYFPNAVREWRR